MQTNFNSLAQNAAVIPDGIELDFRGDKCGHSYRIKKNGVGYWDCFFYDWHDGWINIDHWPGEKLRQDAIALCNKHAIKKRLIKFLPNRPKFKPTWGGIAATAASQIAFAAGFSI